MVSGERRKLPTYRIRCCEESVGRDIAEHKEQRVLTLWEGCAGIRGGLRRGTRVSQSVASKADGIYGEEI